MKGLFIKDVKAIWKAMIVCMIMMFLEYPIGRFMELETEELSSIILFVADMVIVCGIIPITTLTDDYRYGFIKYAQILPISKKAFIGEKYILTMMGEVIFTFIGIVMTYITCYKKVDNLWWIMFVVFPIGLVINSVLLLCITKFGTEHAGVTAIIVILLIVGLMLVTAYLDSNYNLVAIISDNRVSILLSGLIIYALMYLLTTKVYEAKEY